MIDRMQAGSVPAKPHTIHREGDRLTYEHCFTRQGFDGAYSILHHRHPPTHATEWRASERGWKPPQPAPAEILQRRHFQTPRLPTGGRMIDARAPLFFNADLTVLNARPDRDDDVFFANNDGDELHFVLEGRGVVETMFGHLPFGPGDYVFLPRSVLHRWTFTEPGHLFITEAHGWLDIPKNFRNATGQLRMDAPYTHRDFGRPQWPAEGLADASENAPRQVVVKKSGRFTEYTLAHSPLDVVGWDGTVYPFTFAIEKYQPRTGLVHLPPTIHTTFVGQRFVVCSFVPRVTDFHPEAIPCPYPHSSVDCDEILFYVRGNFTSRRGVGPGSISFHPAGVVHGPQPGAYEASIGTTRTDEMAVMLDTFAPLTPTTLAVGIEDPDYMASWAKEG